MDIEEANGKVASALFALSKVHRAKAHEHIENDNLRMASLSLEYAIRYDHYGKNFLSTRAPIINMEDDEKAKGV